MKREISRRLDGRQLVYFGTRGDDAEGVGDQAELAAVFSLIAAHRGRTSVESVALEDLTGERVDLDTYDVDDDLARPEVVELRRAMLRTLWKGSVVFTYRPSTFLSAICFARQDRCLYAGMFKDHQAAFEHKPWVESKVRAMGIPTIPWTYIADEDQLNALPILADGPIVLRRSRSSGGTGLFRIETAAELEAAWPEQDEAFVSVAPFIPDGIPTNVSGVVWHDGVTVHGASVQLIGIPELTSRPFGYCGNDFGAARELPQNVIREMEQATMLVGRWLLSHGFIGGFGVDFLVQGEQVLFTEINPRLQGVTHLACQARAAAGESCVLLEHLAANLGLSAPTSQSLTNQVAEVATLSHVVFHRPPPGVAYAGGLAVGDDLLGRDGVTRLDVVCPPSVTPVPGATIARVTLAARVTDTGLALIEPWASRIAAATVSGS
jgi:hypothetical protein